MWLDELFETFHRRVKLNPDRIARVESAYTGLSSFLKEDDPLSNVFLDLFKQGSFAINTAIKPVDEGKKFDSDSVFILDVSKLPWDRRSPSQVIAWVARRLRENPDYEGKVHQGKRCVRIEYAGEFYADVVPARLTHGLLDPLEVPSKEDGWVISHPRGYVNLMLALDKTQAGKFSLVTSLSKYWRDVHFGNDSRPRSILLTTLIANHIPATAASAAEALVVTMENISNALDAHSAVPWISNPSLVAENLTRDWSSSAYTLFKHRLKVASEMARGALEYAKRDERELSIREWRRVFGDKFPNFTAEDGRRVAAASHASKLLVTSSGLLITSQPAEGVSTAVQPHRFYGDHFQKPLR